MIRFARNLLSILLFLATICIPEGGAAEVAAAPGAVNLAVIDQQIKENTHTSLSQALYKITKALELEPQRYELLIRAARAQIELLNIATDGYIEEREEFKPVLERDGARALAYAEQALALKPDSIEARAATAQAYAFHAASFGVVKAVFNGAADRYETLVQSIIDSDDTYRGGLGYRMLGRMYYLAPFPVGSYKKAEQYLRRSLEKDSSYLETHFFLALTLLERDKDEEAKQEFRYVIENQPNSDEGSYIAAYKARARVLVAE
jgi:tetratricopeptide (TPR) repeat protein